jgi:hypothetical protein
VRGRAQAVEHSVAVPEWRSEEDGADDVRIVLRNVRPMRDIKIVVLENLPPTP